MTLAKKIILISITLILIISSFLLVMNSFAFSSEESKKYEKYDLEDFIGNKFYLFEYLSGGYSIYTESNEFIEGSYNDLSPYHNFIDIKNTLFRTRVIFL